MSPHRDRDHHTEATLLGGDDDLGGDRPAPRRTGATRLRIPRCFIGGAYKTPGPALPPF